MRTDVLNWRDAVIGLLLAALMGLASYQGTTLVPTLVLRSMDFWYESDTAQTFDNMTARDSSHERSGKVHPLFSLLTFGAVFALKHALFIKPATAVALFTSSVASLWMGTLFMLLRLIGCRLLDAVLFSVVAATSASAMFFFIVPTPYGLGSLTILLAFCLVAWAGVRTLAPAWYVVVSALTFSITVTNWMAGVLVTFFTHPWKRALGLTVNAFCLVLVLWGAQKTLFPSAGFLLNYEEEARFTLHPQSEGPLRVAGSFFFHTMVMPAIRTKVHPAALFPKKFVSFEQMRISLGQRLTTQSLNPGSGSVWGRFAVGCWMGLLALGGWALAGSMRGRHRLGVVLALALLGQLVLHMLYGEETFVYSLHFLPLLVLLAALGVLTKARPFVLILAGLMIVTATVNNAQALTEAIAMAKNASPRYQVYEAMEQRPADIWPRAAGHVILAMPGTEAKQKAYHEPGGSLSPGVGSFGVSIWMVNDNGQPVVTSETLPLGDIRQALRQTDTRSIPALVTDTPYYQAVWTVTDPGSPQLHLTASTDDTPVIMIRSVGPAGGPINSLHWDGRRLRISERWSVNIDPLPAGVFLGEEGPSGWMSEHSPVSRSVHESGWGYARIELGKQATKSRADRVWHMTIEEDRAPVRLHPLRITPPTLHADLPDKRFMASLQAQIAHLLMGLVDQETRPGDPVTYPLSWVRQGAYVIVALARTGQLEAAKELSVSLAERDFSSGFGSEADAPGVAIWALEAVARRATDLDYDRWLWPHIRRKAEWIEKMHSTDRLLRAPYVGSVAPAFVEIPDLDVVAKPPRDGLIVGRMDLQWPIFFVNAVSYRGLLDAAALADRVRQPEEATRWRAHARLLKQAWGTAFASSQTENPRAYVASLWPTGIAASSIKRLRQGLETRWQLLRDEAGWFRDRPRWTYFDLAEAHQWLWLGRSDRVWPTLQWFWDHQASPGLYTWWEAQGKADYFSRWNAVRGWANPPHVTPQYWTAAEMALLQLDMLAYVDDTSPEQTVVIGAGIPPDWLIHPMKVIGFPLPTGQLDWIWDGSGMQVTLHGTTVKIKLGPVFPPRTKLHLKVQPS